METINVKIQQRNVKRMSKMGKNTCMDMFKDLNNIFGLKIRNKNLDKLQMDTLLYKLDMQAWPDILLDRRAQSQSV